MIPYAEEPNAFQGNVVFHPLGEGRDYTREGRARVLLDMLQPNTHYRFVGKGQWGTQVTQLYAKAFSLRWGTLSVVGAPRKIQLAADLLRFHNQTDRRWDIPQNGIKQVQVYSNRRLVWEGKL